ncbi:unnamed protein product [Soboliphyme baturini]|uniref:Pept_C1 domain-containing protein n=1 Tax=Soboliphyme baturini TaxID=241478 RepID=A0A183IF68_9BILA|nr:unnamed protein product [Soboliphyme baturini]
MGVNPQYANPKIKLRVVSHSDLSSVAIPEEFDARKEWYMCPTIGEIRDQGNCGSCWAFGAVEAISDRICIASKGAKIRRISARDLLSCCKLCGMGCNGGWPTAAWMFYVSRGIVTGGDYNSSIGCEPYPLRPCDHHINGTHGSCGSKIEPTPRCEHTCQPNYTNSYEKDKNYGYDSYRVKKSVESIQKEIMLNGPVEAAFKVYEDFLSYKHGVYQHHVGMSLGGHAVRLLGWGVENGTKYWLLANSWNVEWGDHGFFKMKLGNNECGIESDIVAGRPRKDKFVKQEDF